MRRFAIASLFMVVLVAFASTSEAGCRGGRCGRGWFPGRAVARGTVGFFRNVRPVRRAVKGAAVVATAPVRAVGRATFRPQGRLLRCGPGGCH